nr:SMC-Scp complex subunit ScpB [Pseudonocardia ammonioxydans]
MATAAVTDDSEAADRTDALNSGAERDLAEDTEPGLAGDTERELAGDIERELDGGTEPAEDPEREPAGDTEPGLAGDAEPGLAGDTELELTEDTELELALEALLLVVDSPIDEASLASTLDQTPSRIRQTLNRMSLAYTADRRGIDLRRAGGGWRFYTRDRYAPYVEKLLLDGQRARLTRAALETLAVVAYRQPVTRARVSAVRGVNCDGVLRTLLTRGLVEEAGTEEQTGGTLFRTTELFLERLGLSSVQELPPLAPLLPDIDAIDDLDGI